MRLRFILLLLLLAVAPNAYAQSAEEEGVRQAVLDYVEAIYNVEPDRIHKSVHKELAKRGYWRGDTNAAYDESPMNFDQLVGVAERWNSNGRVDPDEAVKDVIIYEVLDQTASIKLVAHWGIDYMHLAKYDGKWMIVNVLWQSHPNS